jgi:TRAP-type mannitol/chloroaromatic compound transport system permease small subunit
VHLIEPAERSRPSRSEREPGKASAAAASHEPADAARPEAHGAVAGVSRFFAWVAGALILFSALLVSTDVVLRGLFNLSALNSFELSTYAFAASVTLGHAYALISRSHIRIEVAYMQLPRRIRDYLDIVSIILLAGSAVMLVYFAFRTLQFSYKIGAHSNSALAVPLVVPQGIWFFGLALFALTACWLTVQALFHLVTGRSDRISRNIGVISPQEEISLQADLIGSLDDAGATRPEGAAGIGGRTRQ